MYITNNNKNNFFSFAGEKMKEPSPPPTPTSTTRYSHLSSYQFWQVSESGPPEQCYWGNSPGGQPRLHSNLPEPGEELVSPSGKKGHSCLLNSIAQSFFHLNLSLMSFARRQNVATMTNPHNGMFAGTLDGILVACLHPLEM